MTYTKTLLFGLVIILLSCRVEKTAKREIYNEDFKWTITIPENFESVSSADWLKMQGKGVDAIEKTFEGEKVINQSKIIFVFKSDQLNYFESVYQPFDPSVDGDYLESCKALGKILHETFMTQMPGIKVDTVRTTEKIDNLEFQKFLIKVKYPNDMVLNLLMYSRLFDKRDLGVNIMYVDEEKGTRMLEAWRESRFAK